MAHVGRLDRDRTTFGTVAHPDADREGGDDSGDRRSATEDEVRVDRLVDHPFDGIRREHDRDRPDEREQVDAVEDVEPLRVSQAPFPTDPAQVTQYRRVGLDVFAHRRATVSGCRPSRAQRRQTGGVTPTDSPRRPIVRRALVGLAAVALVASACGSDDTVSTADAASESVSSTAPSEDAVGLQRRRVGWRGDPDAPAERSDHRRR